MGLGFFIEVDECVDGELIGAEEAFAVDAFSVVIEVIDGGVGPGFEGGFPLSDVVGIEVWGDPPGFLIGVPTGAECFGFIFVFKGDGDVEAVIAAGGDEGGLEGVWAPGGGDGGVEAEVEEEVFEEGAEDFFLFEAKGGAGGLVDGLDEVLDAFAYTAEFGVGVDVEGGEAEGCVFAEGEGGA